MGVRDWVRAQGEGYQRVGSKEVWGTGDG